MRFLNDNEMGVRIGRLMQERGLTLASAESCTGGTIASMVTAVAGSSAYFKGAVVSYAVEVKEEVLGVKIKSAEGCCGDLKGEGTKEEDMSVVSESTARQMAEGVARLLKADCAVATTGIAGPGGAEPGKPVGTVCIAARIPAGHGAKSAVHSKTFHFQGDRESVILQAADCALRLLEETLLEETHVKERNVPQRKNK